ncbi:ABC-type transport auxiliary lipoprotein family protein [Yoonia sp. SDW83-1]|uniref:ABC-type transport auxiliary lipoprotein family protein n=1 Tax=Yoonia sp. SDW83-1 TaxID=3366945 RepID=UPI00398C2826
MNRQLLTRRFFVLGAISLPGCTALNTLNQAAQPRDTYDLNPVELEGGQRGTRSLLVLVPTAPATIVTDRILIKPTPISVAYLPDVRWADEVPLLVQSLLIRSLSFSGQFGFVGPQAAGPVPDFVVLTRIDQFGVDALPDGSFKAVVQMNITVLRDRDQRVIGTRRFEGSALPSNDLAVPVVQAFQQILDALLPDAVRWIGARA